MSDSLPVARTLADGVCTTIALRHGKNSNFTSFSAWVHYARKKIVPYFSPLIVEIAYLDRSAAILVCNATATLSGERRASYSTIQVDERTPR